MENGKVGGKMGKEDKGFVNEYKVALHYYGKGQTEEKRVNYAQGLASTEQFIHFQFRFFCTESADD